MSSKSDLKAELDAIVQQLAADLEQGMLSSLPSNMLDNLDLAIERQPNNSGAQEIPSTTRNLLSASDSHQENIGRADLLRNAERSSAFTNSLQGLLTNQLKTDIPSQGSAQVNLKEGKQNPYSSLLPQLSSELGKFLRSTQESVSLPLPGADLGRGTSSVLSTVASQATQRSANPLRWLSSPLTAGLGWLFGKGDDEEPIMPPLANLPSRMSLDAGYDRRQNQLVAISGSAGGMSRPVASEFSNIQPNITVQVNALDTRSFVDHSNEIAQALRKAMLESHSINDMLAEL